MKEEAAGTAKIVYFDESYIHAYQASKYGWVSAGDCDVIGDDKGKRRMGCWQYLMLLPVIGSASLL